MSTYRAVQVTSPGKFELVKRPLLDPSSGRVRICVEACGIRDSDSVTVDALAPGMTPVEAIVIQRSASVRHDVH